MSQITKNVAISFFAFFAFVFLCCISQYKPIEKQVTEEDNAAYLEENQRIYDEITESFDELVMPVMLDFVEEYTDTIYNTEKSVEMIEEYTSVDIIEYINLDN